jgi:hypothetical protein
MQAQSNLTGDQTMKTAVLTGAALDWAVAKCVGHIDDETIIRRLEPDEDGWCIAYSTDWAQGGPIIEREWISVSKPVNSLTWVATMHYQNEDTDDVMWMEETGTTPLIAAMRCYVASKLGDEVEIPEELLSCADD